MEVLEFEDLGMEAAWRIEVEDFPVFIVINPEGKDFYADLTSQRPPHWSNWMRRERKKNK